MLAYNLLRGKQHPEKNFYVCEIFRDENWDFNFKFRFYAGNMLFRKNTGNVRYSILRIIGVLD